MHKIIFRYKNKFDSDEDYFKNSSIVLKTNNNLFLQPFKVKTSNFN